MIRGYEVPKKSRIVRIATILGGIALTGAGHTQNGPFERCGNFAMTYKYPGKHGLGEQYQGGKWQRINLEFAPPTSGKSAPKASNRDDGSIYEIVNCSTTEFICVRTYQWVFALPVGDHMPGLDYEVAGAKLRIIGCVSDQDHSCRTILVTSDCRAPGTGVGRLRPGEVVGNNCQANGWGLKMMFLFDRDRGVIAYEKADGLPDAADLSKWDLSTLGVSAGMRALVGRKGLLSCAQSPAD